MTERNVMKERVQRIALEQLRNADVKAELRSEGVWLDVCFYGLGDCLIIAPWEVAQKEDCEIAYWLRRKIDDRVEYLQKEK